MVVSKSEFACKVKAELSHHKREPLKVEKKVKSESLKSTKPEATVKREAKTKDVKPCVDDLVKRGIALRAKAEQMEKKVKKEAIHQKRGKAERRVKKRRVTAKRRNSSREAMLRPVTLSEELQGLLGEKALSRPETVKRIWAYSKDQNLINPSNKREILCDERLQALLGQETVGLLDLQKVLMPHFDYSVPAQNSSSSNTSVKKAKVEVKTKVTPKKEEEKVKSEDLKFESKIKQDVKQEASSKAQVPVASAEAASKDVTLRLTALHPTSLTVEALSKTASFAGLQVQVVAEVRKSDGEKSKDIRQDCSFILRETPDGQWESFLTVTLKDLEPAQPYSVFMEACRTLLACFSAQNTHLETGSNNPRRDPGWSTSYGVFPSSRVYLGSFGLLWRPRFGMLYRRLVRLASKAKFGPQIHLQYCRPHGCFGGNFNHAVT